MSHFIFLTIFSEFFEKIEAVTNLHDLQLVIEKAGTSSLIKKNRAAKTMLNKSSFFFECIYLKK